MSCWAISPTDEDYLKTGISIYHRRLSHYLNFDYREFTFKSGKTFSAEDHREAEKNEILKQLRPADFLILLDEKGKEYTSLEFAAYLDKKFIEISGNMIFLTGGPYGFHPEIYRRANQMLSLSKMTFTHQMARLFFLEQLYRAMTILRNEKYHHE